MQSLSNTQLRIISAIILLIILLILMNLGAYYMLGLIFVVGLLLTDEILVNFTGIERNQINYLSMQALFALMFLVFNSLFILDNLHYPIHFLGIVINVTFILVLFFYETFGKRVIENLGEKRWYWVVIFSVLMLNFASAFYHSQWRIVVWGIIILNFATDTGAWLIGKNFGKHKLWPSVSPGKTIEGFLGGIALATIFSALYWWNFMPKMETNFLVCLFILTIFSQVGDLVQSRLKRSFNIKDSSNIIPGHGGIHDRIDSLLFVMPFYLVIIKHYFL